tara:strand:- start:1657 stop:2076 length:420 start_codon:yes stop_codon:yes gene_type:complete
MDITEIRELYKELSSLNLRRGIKERHYSYYDVSQGSPFRSRCAFVIPKFVEPVKQAGKIIYGLCDEIEKLRNEVAYLVNKHDKAERKLLKKISNAKSEQSHTAGKTNKESTTKVHPVGGGSSGPGGSDEPALENGAGRA